MYRKELVTAVIGIVVGIGILWGVLVFVSQSSAAIPEPDSTPARTLTEPNKALADWTIWEILEELISRFQFVIYVIYFILLFISLGYGLGSGERIGQGWKAAFPIKSSPRKPCPKGYDEHGNPIYNERELHEYDKQVNSKWIPFFSAMSWGIAVAVLAILTQLVCC